MKPLFSKKRLLGFTLIEVLVVIGVVALLAVVVLPNLISAKNKSSKISCVGRLKQIGLAHRIFANDYTNLYTAMLSTNDGGSFEYVGQGAFNHFRSLSNELSTPRVLACPADTRKPALNFTELSNSNVSYFVGLYAEETRPNMVLSGDRNIETGVLPTNGILRLTTNFPARWTSAIHQRQGNIGLADGSVSQFSESGLRRQIEASQAAGDTNRIEIP